MKLTEAQKAFCIYYSDGECLNEAEYDSIESYASDTDIFAENEKDSSEIEDEIKKLSFERWYIGLMEGFMKGYEAGYMAGKNAS